MADRNEKWIEWLRNKTLPPRTFQNWVEEHLWNQFCDLQDRYDKLVRTTELGKEPPFAYLKLECRKPAQKRAWCAFLWEVIGDETHVVMMSTANDLERSALDYAKRRALPLYVLTEDGVTLLQNAH